VPASGGIALVRLPGLEGVEGDLAEHADAAEGGRGAGELAAGAGAEQRHQRAAGERALAEVAEHGVALRARGGQVHVLLREVGALGGQVLAGGEHLVEQVLKRHRDVSGRESVVVARDAVLGRSEKSSPPLGLRRAPWGSSTVGGLVATG
jgi:hypothetical protein